MAKLSWVKVELEDHYTRLPFIIVDEMVRKMEYAIIQQGHKPILITEPEVSADTIGYVSIMYGEPVG